jgi:hypothetical protein
LSNGTDQPPEVPPVLTPDLKQSAKLSSAGWRDSNIIPHIVSSVFAVLIDGLQKMITLLAGVFDDIAALVTEFFTAAQGQDTPGFNRLVAAVLSDTLGVEVNAADLQAAQFEGGRVAAMDKVGADLFNTLGNEFISQQATSEPGAGIGGLPGNPGVPLTPEQGVKAAQSFIGFALSFAVRQGNVAFLSSALPWEWLSGIREYGEMMAKNLGLGRLVRRALQPYIQTLIAAPLQEALNRQYRPHVLDAKQIASAFIRGDIDASDYRNRLQGLGYKDGDIDLLIRDTYTRLNQGEVFILHENGIISDSDAQARILALGFNSSDFPLLQQARQYNAVQGADRKYADILATEHAEGLIDDTLFENEVLGLRIPKLERDAIIRNAVARRHQKRKQLSLGFMRRAYLDGQATIDELMAHVLALGYNQADADLIEVEILFQQAEKKAVAAAKAKAAAAKAAGKATTTPPTTP